MSNVKNNNHIIYDYDNGDRFIVIIKRPVGHNIIFTVKNGGIYYNDMSNTKGVSMLSTVDKNRNNYTQRQYGHANIARELYQIAVHPLIKDYKKIIKMNAIKTFTVIIKDINRCEYIFSNDIYTLKGKTVRTKPKAVVNDYIDITQELKDTHKNIEICA